MRAHFRLEQLRVSYFNLLNFLSRALADILYIYPNKRKKKSFENKRDEILRNGLEAAISGRNNDNAATKTGRSAKGKADLNNANKGLT